MTPACATPRIVTVLPGRRATRCVLCHDDLGDRVLRCMRCGVALHEECRVPRCPTLGCVAPGSIQLLGVPEPEPVGDWTVPLIRPPRIGDESGDAIAPYVAVLLGIFLVTALVSPVAALGAGFAMLFLAGAPILAFLAGRTWRERLGGALIGIALEALLWAFVVGTLNLLGALLLPFILSGPAVLGLAAIHLARQHEPGTGRRQPA